MKMPSAIQRYIDSNNSGDWARLAGCFSAKASVHDEGEQHSGRGGIGLWARSAMQKYEMEMWPVSLREGASSFVLVAKVAGNFPVNPSERSFHFQLKGEEITSLKILC